jgi:hypothetical protein
MFRASSPRFRRLHCAVQRVIAGIVPLGLGMALGWVTVPLADAVPDRFVVLLWRHFPGWQFEWIVGAIGVVTFLPLLLGGYVLGWWFIRPIVSWEVAERSLSGDDGKLAPLHAWIAKWYKFKHARGT